MVFGDREHLFDRSAVEVEIDVEAGGLGLMIHAVTELEGQLEPPSRTQHSCRLGEYGGQGLIGNMDDGIPGDESGDAVVEVRQRGHRPGGEVKVRVEASCLGDHRGGEVEARGAQPQGGKECRDPTWAAPDLKGLGMSCGEHEFGEGAEDRTVMRLRSELGRNPVCVRLRDRIIGGSGGALPGCRLDLFL